MRGQHWAGLVAGLLAAGCVAAATHAAAPESSPSDWPSYRAGHGRAAYAQRPLSANLQLRWVHTPRQTPQPAWPAPARGSYWQQLTDIAPRVVDDHTFHPVAVGGSVLFASSADDSLVCLDATTGQVRWRRTTGGPVRYAPVVAENRVYAGSDDGHLYCLALADGSIQWQQRLAPVQRLVSGNGRLISPWPVRTGVVVDQGKVYAAAGLYPSQGVYVAALSADTGEFVWRQQIGDAAHGYMLIAEDRLIVPTGRSTPIVLAVADGQLLGKLPGAPGSYAVAVERDIFTGRGNEGALEATRLGVSESLVSIAARHLCVTPDASLLLGSGLLRAIDLTRYTELSAALTAQQNKYKRLADHAAELEASGETPGQLQRIRTELNETTQRIDELNTARNACEKWSLATSHTGCLAAAGDTAVVGGRGGAELHALDDGRLLGQVEIEGIALGIAIADGQLYLSNEQGSIYCFGEHAGTPDQSSTDAMQNLETAPTDQWQEAVEQIVAEHLTPTFGGTLGYGVVVGGGNLELLDALVRGTDLKLLVLDDDHARVDAIRTRYLEQGVYGTRLAALHAPAGTLPVADYTANLVVSSRRLASEAETRWDTSELMRLVRPAGGVAWLSRAGPPERRPPLPGAGSWTHQYGNLGNTAATDDSHIHWDLRLQWFGGPGPAQMVDRHLRAPAPLAADGRLLVGGENTLVCVDSYHGTEYWRMELPGAQRYSMPYDCGYASLKGDLLATAVRDRVWLVDVQTGDVLQKIAAPRVESVEQPHWGYVGLTSEALLGATQKSTASRTRPSREQIDLDYRNVRPTVACQALFSMDQADGALHWMHEATILNPTIAVGDDRIYFVGSESRRLAEHPTGRIFLSPFMAESPQLVALDLRSGEPTWQRPLDPFMRICTNILYLQATPERLIVSGSYTRDNDSWYRVAVIDNATGETQWTAEHAKEKPGEFSHGEQVHHPVVLGDRLVAEPVIYELATGRRVTPRGEPNSWTIRRPAHSCGTMSGAGDCLFFRSGNPTVMGLDSTLQGERRFRSISPSRPGCWINIIPADGLVLIPEASASCVCHYSLQTSMAFQSVPPPGMNDTTAPDRRADQ